MTRIIITGAKGRMGQALSRRAGDFSELQVSGQIDQGDDLRSVILDGDVVVDFSIHTATAGIARLCAEKKKALIIGTTGHSESEKAAVRACASAIPMVWASNYSTGVNTLFWLAERAAKILGTNFDIEIVEMHHRLKKDSPSGTATTLAEILSAARQQQAREVLRHGRQGIVGERTNVEIGMHAIRGGDVVGDHTVIFAAEGERVELTHKASSRDTFANGALRAAIWVVGKNPGIYSMQDVLGLA